MCACIGVFKKLCRVMKGRGGDGGGRLEVLHMRTSFSAPLPTCLRPSNLPDDGGYMVIALWTPLRLQAGRAQIGACSLSCKVQ